MRNRTVTDFGIAQTQLATKPTASSLTRRVLQRTCACGQHSGSDGECEACKQKRASTLQRAAISPSPAQQVPPIVHDVLRSAGRPLDGATRTFMESRFGHDFSHVRIHTDSQAAESTRAVNALAYTVGNHVVFDAGQYAPQTSSGLRVVAHELAHVVQQSGSAIGDGLSIGAAHDAYEHEAESIAAQVDGASPIPTSARQTPKLGHTQAATIQRIEPVAAAGAVAAAGVAGGAAAAAGALIAIVSFEAALNYGKSLATRFPGWLSVLPNCPCTEAVVLADPATWGRDRNPALSWFHPGAASSYRSNSTFTTVPGSAHGQQCTYDSSGNLITDGPGAGTPDSWSPNTNGAAHTWYDVASWQLLGWRIYNRYWQPNNGNGCAANQGDNTLMRRFSEFIP